MSGNEAIQSEKNKKALDMITEEEADWDNALEEAMMYVLENDIKDKDGK